MKSKVPYLARRGDIYQFRIAVPERHRQHLGCVELTKSLETPCRKRATPLALELAALTKRIFIELDSSGTNSMDNEKLRLMYQAWTQKQKNHQLEELHLQETVELLAQQKQEQSALTDKIKAGILDDLVKSGGLPSGTSPAAVQPEKKEPTAPTLGTVVTNFLDNYPADKYPAMLKKHKPVLAMFLEIVGAAKPINELKQADINRFFSIVLRLPPRWADKCKAQKITVLQLAESNNSGGISPKTFEDTYVACIRPFLIAAKKDFLDQGFPPHLTTEGIEYRGDRDEGENKQRAFKNAELARLRASQILQIKWYTAENLCESMEHQRN